MQQEAPKPDDTPKQTPAPQAEAKKQPRPEPTRYGDWEIGGRCIDF